MKVLLVYPETPSTFWSFKEALKFVSKKSAEPPLGLITIASMLPEEWDKKLIDLNVSKLTDKNISWADYVFISAMNVHLKSFRDIVRRCNKLGVKVAAGGPLCTTQYNELLGVDHFILNEAEITLPLFLADLKNGSPKHIYQTDEFPDISLAPVPMWELLDMKKYASMSLQYSRGCPYDCEFCSITMLNGRRPRAKSTDQFITELNRLYELGWRGGVSVVDDNFIGNKRKLKEDTLPALIKWSKEKKYPFFFITEVSINLADDEQLMKLMVEAGFNSIFVGIETPNNESLNECGKKQNLKRDLIQSVNRLQKNGMLVSGGFIVGFDNDTENIFDDQIDFIQRSGIPNAMVGLLNAPTGTKLYNRMRDEGRLLDMFSGNNMDASINFIPKMNYKNLIQGYSRLLNTIYSQEEYYNRLKIFLKEYNVPEWTPKIINLEQLKAFVRLLWLLGIIEKGKKYFWKLFFVSLWKYPRKFPTAMTLAVYGFHFRRVIRTV
ncbi:MAG: B12-binding domain-containing radical SAM protein [Ignavibacteriales bacterium]|nr:B12-binding domain-containing radical SAM protein [Ignavibacterium sp.]MCZ2270079.1 B12-binding domain-containing radical SAM protein [Ignavibacteriales bacterium]HMN18071.1 B12-binding domain-containing radical SAM protein [Ignavibacteriaceae bacterium]